MTPAPVSVVQDTVEQIVGRSAKKQSMVLLNAYPAFRFFVCLCVCDSVRVYLRARGVCDNIQLRTRFTIALYVFTVTD